MKRSDVVAQDRHHLAERLVAEEKAALEVLAEVRAKLALLSAGRRVCVWCGDVLVNPTYATSKYCSTACRQKNYRWKVLNGQSFD